MTQRHVQYRNCRTCRRPRPASSPGARPGAPPACLDWPLGKEGEEAERQRRRFQTTLAVADLIHLEVVVDTILTDNVKGDFMEAGVFRGGACIMLRGLLAAKRDLHRRVYVADSFAGIPPPRRHIEDVSTGKVLDPESRPDV